jgi:phosphate transport system substrate-binding protein
MAEIMSLWEKGFHRYQPGVTFDDRLKGTVSGMAGLYSGVTDLSLMGREIWPAEVMAYQQVTGHFPTGIQVAIGSYDVPTKADALVIFVHRDNPVSVLTLLQLQRIFSCGDEAESSVRNWGDLGVQGPFAAKRIHVYGYRLDNAAAIFFKNTVLKQAEWRCGITTFSNQTGPDGNRIDSGQLILDALRKDPGGIAISNPHYANSVVKSVSLALKSGGSPIPPTKEAVASGRYPLARAIYLYFNREAGKPPDPRVIEFLRYVLSSEGQEDVVREGAYLPLPENVRRAQLDGLR